MPEAQPTSDIYGILLDDQARILLLPDGNGGWTLPHVHVPDERVWVPNVGIVCVGMSHMLAAEITVLRNASTYYSDDRLLARLICVIENQTEDWTAPEQAKWVHQAELEGLPLTYPEHQPIIASEMAEAETGQVPHLRPPWAQPGWFKLASSWMREQLTQHSYTFLSPIEQTKSWGISCLLRANTDRGHVYFKVATALPLFGNEPALLKALGERYPDFVPAPLAIEPDQRWMLMTDFGAELRTMPSLERYQSAVERFGQLQVQAASAIDDLLAIGCLDRRLHVLLEQIEPLFGDEAVLALLSADEIDRLRALVPRLKRMCEELASYDVPYSLVHGDLHSGNITGESLLFFDWTDACITHPFLDLCPVMSDVEYDLPEGREPVLEVYLSQWLAYEPMERLRSMWRLAEPLGALHQAVSYQHILATLEPTSKQELIWGVPEWLGRLLKTMPADLS